MALDRRHTTYLSAAAIAGWLVLLLGAIQVGYSFNVTDLLGLGVMVFALVGLTITLLVIFRRSSATLVEKIVIGLLSLVTFAGFTFVTGLLVACANGDCL